MLGMEEESHWTDSLPLCTNTGVGTLHDAETVAFHRGDETSSFFLYCVLNGHNGPQCATFCVQRLPAELLLGQLKTKITDEEIEYQLRQAFIAVEKCFLESLDEKIAKRTSLLFEMSESLGSCIEGEIESIDKELSCGCTTIVSLVLANKLYVANIGDCRALICKTDEDQVLRVLQLSMDHDFKNDDEIIRLKNMGIDDRDLKQADKYFTRCVGNFLLKENFKKLKCLPTEEVILAEPEIQGIKLDESIRFLLLLSGGLCKCLDEMWEDDKANQQLAEIVAKEFRDKSDLGSIAQAVVDRIAKLYEDKFDKPPRKDLMLLLRNFNYPLKRPQVSTPDLVPTVANSLGESEVITETEEDQSTTSTSTIEIEKEPKPHIEPYVDFNEFNMNIQIARENGTLPPELMDLFP